MSSTAFQEVGAAFVKEFFETFHVAPENLYRFFGAQSVFSFVSEPSEPVHASNLSEIKDVLQSLNLSSIKIGKINLPGVLTQPLESNILVLTNGVWAASSPPLRRFLANFILAPSRSAQHYYVKNAAFVLLKDENLSSSAHSSSSSVHHHHSADHHHHSKEPAAAVVEQHVEEVSSASSSTTATTPSTSPSTTVSSSEVHSHVEDHSHHAESSSPASPSSSSSTPSTTSASSESTTPVETAAPVVAEAPVVPKTYASVTGGSPAVPPAAPKSKPAASSPASNAAGNKGRSPKPASGKSGPRTPKSSGSSSSSSSSSASSSSSSASSSRPPKQSKPSDTLSIVVRGLSSGFPEAELKAIFERIGTIDSLNTDLTKSRLAFVNISGVANPPAVLKTLVEANYVVGGVPIKIEQARSGRRRSPRHSDHPRRE